MAISQTHYRSISLPSRLHSISANFETQLQNLKSLEISSNSETIQCGLVRIAELYNSVDETAQSQNKSINLLLEEKSMDESLSGSVELLDYCSAIKEVLQMMKENVQALQSALRRKGTDLSIQNDVALYFTCRKRTNKCLAKTLKTLNKSEHRGSNVSVNGESNFTSVLRKLKGVVIAILKSVAVFLFSPMGRWSKKVMMNIAKSGRGNDDDEVGNVELCLRKMRSFDGFTVVDVQKKLHNLEAIVEGFEGGLDRLFRQLVRVRVTLLNIFTDY